jgi:predicted DCC family thiol-disulfide oxidoreductase YuxK
MMSETTLLYDADCGFCRWTSDRVRRWDRRGSLRVIPIQSAEAQALLGDMEGERKMASWHLVEEDGAVRSAGAGVAPLLRLLPGGKPLAVMAGLFPKSTDRLYRLVARNRETLGRILGEQACAVDPSGRSRHEP